MSGNPWENEEKRNLIYLVDVVNGVVSESLRTIFKQEWNSRYQAKFGAWDDTNVSGQQLYHFEKKRKGAKYLSTFQNGDTSQWDFSVLSNVILFSNSIGKASLSPIRKSEVHNLTEIRNTVKHSAEGKLSESDFKRLTTDVENAFKALGLPTNEITRIKAERNRYKSFQVLPPKPAHDVIPRAEKIRKISEDLENLGNEGKLTYFYISGNPGSGKSQLARQICEHIWQGVKWSEEPTFMMTFNGKDADSLLKSYEDFARRLNCDERLLEKMLISTKTKEEKIKDLRSVISTKMKNWKKWWLVVDNVENLEIISPLLPMTCDDIWNNGQIIVTTQNRTHVPSDSLLTKHVSISRGMSDLESRQLLSSLSGTDANDPLLDDVAKQLDFQPLAMAAGAVYFNRVVKATRKFSWHDYLQKLESGKRQITERQLCNINPAYPSTMTAAVMLAVENCIENDSNLKHAFQFLSFVSFESMPLALFARYTQQVDENFDQAEVFLAIQHCSLFLPAENEDGDIRLHRIVHEVIKFLFQGNEKAEMNHDLQARGAGRECSDTKHQFQNVIRTLYQFKDRLDKGKLVPHLRAFNVAVKKLCQEDEQFYKRGSSTDTYSTFQMYMFFGDLLREHYKLKLSLDFLNSSLELAHGLIDEIYIADVYNRMGVVYGKTGEYEKEKNYFQRALQIRKEHFGEKHLNVASCYNNLGNAYGSTSEYETAKDYHQRALEIRKEVSGEKHVGVADSYNNLGIVYKCTGEYEKAKDYHLRALKMQIELLGEKHIDVAGSFYNLGIVCQSTGEYGKAKDYYQRALDIQKELLGEKHVDVASSYNNLGRVYEITEKYENGKGCYLRALGIQKDLLGEKHEYVAGSYFNLGNVYQCTGDYETAKDCYQRAREIGRELRRPILLCLQTTV